MSLLPPHASRNSYVRAWSVCLPVMLLSILLPWAHRARLPDPMPVHFDLHGMADGWLPRDLACWHHSVIALLISLPLLLIMTLLHSTPTRWINLPNRDYWLADQRRGATLRTLKTLLVWLLAASHALLIGLWTLARQQGLTPELPVGRSLWILLAAFLGFILVATTFLHRRFLIIPNASRDSTS